MTHHLQLRGGTPAQNLLHTALVALATERAASERREALLAIAAHLMESTAVELRRLLAHTNIAYRF